MKKVLQTSLVLVFAVIIFSATPIKAKADSSMIVTLGANLSEEQKKTMLEFFGVNENSVEIIEVTNQDERRYLTGIATEQQIGTRTYSCSFIQPFTSGGINVKTVNLQWVTGEMIRNTLITSGVTNCNVVAAAPMLVSGTGALTGIFMAYEEASGEELEEEKTEIASQELIVTIHIANDIGQEEAAELISEVKEEVILNGVTDENAIQEIIEDYELGNSIHLTEEQRNNLVGLMLRISEQDYNVSEIKDVYDNIKNSVQDTKEKSSSFFGKVKDWFGNLFSKGKDAVEESGILGEIDASILGDNVIITSTDDIGDLLQNSINGEKSKDEKVGFFKRISNKVKSWFQSGDIEPTESSEDAPFEIMNESEEFFDTDNNIDNNNIDNNNIDNTENTDNMGNADDINDTDDVVNTEEIEGN